MNKSKKQFYEAMDANLIAAAPDLLAVVEFIKQFVDEGSQNVHFCALATDDDETTLGQLINKVVAKAKGEL